MSASRRTRRAGVARRRAERIKERPIPGSTGVEVARGWAAHMRRGMQVELPPGRLADAVQANRRFLTLAHQGGRVARRGDAPMIMTALDLMGFHPEADDIRRALPRRHRSREVRSHTEADADRGLERLDELLAAASPTFTWPDTMATAAEFLSMVRALLVREMPDGLALCGVIPAAWMGQAVEVHDAPTDFGTISFAVRWHGDRAALLWELAPRDQVPVRIT